LIACPRPNEVDKEAMGRTFPFGIKTIELRQGGMISEGIDAQQSGDKKADALVANTAIKVSANTHRRTPSPENIKIVLAPFDLCRRRDGCHFEEEHFHGSCTIFDTLNSEVLK
ncbi:MAG: Lin0512 family protein, partial [Candidatus Hydrogenedentota bacterium]